MRRVRTFGFHLATLDVTQHAHVHDEVIAQGIRSAGLADACAAGAFAPVTRFLARDQGPTGTFDAIGRRSLWVFEAIAHARHKFGARAIGDYIVSGARGPEDVLAVLLLARWADIIDKRTGECPLDVAPLLESIQSLEQAGDVLTKLYAEPAYRRHLAARGNRQQVVIGYSDTNKEGGIAASRWALQVAQIQLLDAANVADIRLAIFHSRGGTPPRGGGPTDHLVEAAPRWLDTGRASPYRAGRSGEPKLWPAAHRHAHAGADLRGGGLGDGPRRPSAHHTGGTRRDANHCEMQPRGLPAAGVRQCPFFRLFPRRDAARRDRAHAHRVAPRHASRAPWARARCAPSPGYSPGLRAATWFRAGSASAVA